MHRNGNNLKGTELSGGYFLKIVNKKIFQKKIFLENR